MTAMQDSDKQGNDKKVIDEDFLMSMMAGEEKADGRDFPKTDDTNEPPRAKPPARGKIKSKKPAETDYETLFFRNPDTAARNGKSVYIRPEYHERLTRIVQVIGEDKLTIYAYLDNVLEHHFKEFGEQIITSFNEKYKPIL